MNPLTTADIQWQHDEHGNITPVSTVFDDVYFSKAGGLDETNHVFLSANDLPKRFDQLEPQHSFTIMETGFGTGLNFLATCLLWSKHFDKDKNNRLYFVSTEKFPLTKTDLQTALLVWQNTPDILPFINALLDNYPPLLKGCHRLHFSHNIVLDLWLGDSSESFEVMTAKADAWFLDGFTPSKNSELWCDAIFTQIKRLSKPGTTLATFTSAGFVKRHLQDIGMTVKKIKGFGKKREMLTAYFDGNHQAPAIPKSAIIIGAGVSGVLTAYALSKRGMAVTLIDKNGMMSGASGNPAALVAPKLTLIDQSADHLSTVSFLYAERYYQQINQALEDDKCFRQTGVIDFLLPTKKTSAKLKALIEPYPCELIDECSHSFEDFERQTIATFVKSAGVVHTKKLANLINHHSITFRQMDITLIDESDDFVMVTDGDQNIYADIAVICAGFESYLLNQNLFNPRKIRGQISWFDVSNINQEIKNLLNTPIKYDGYCVKFDEKLLIGASFVRNDTAVDERDDEHEFNRTKFTQSLPSLANSLNLKHQALHGRAAIRAQTPDYHPLVGKIKSSHRIYTNYGMGSKGFSFAPLCSEILASLICAEPLPVSDKLLAKISPNRERLLTPINQNA